MLCRNNIARILRSFDNVAKQSELTNDFKNMEQRLYNAIKSP